MKKLATITFMASIGLFSACNNPDGGVERDGLADATEDTAVVADDSRSRVTADGVEVKQMDDSFWAGIDRKAPVRNDARLAGTGVEARGTDEYTIYSADENVLFDVDKASLRTGAEDKLKSIAESINETGGQGEVRIMGYTDSTASAAYNKELADERANTVKDWLQQNGNIDAARLSTEAVGQADPVATNATPEGRQQNRRVEIVVVNQ